MLSLPPQLCTFDVFHSIGNKLGTFFEADMSFQEHQRKTLARATINLNPCKGFLNELTISYKRYSQCQPLDYEGFPFHCHYFYKIAHVLKEFPIPYIGKYGCQGFRKGDFHGVSQEEKGCKTEEDPPSQALQSRVVSKGQVDEGGA